MRRIKVSTWTWAQQFKENVVYLSIVRRTQAIKTIVPLFHLCHSIPLLETFKQHFPLSSLKRPRHVCSECDQCRLRVNQWVLPGLCVRWVLPRRLWTPVQSWPPLEKLKNLKPFASVFFCVFPWQPWWKLCWNTASLQNPLPSVPQHCGGAWNAPVGDLSFCPASRETVSISCSPYKTFEPF